MIKTDAGSLTDSPPVCYQEINGLNVPVNGKYCLIDAQRIGFDIESYDRRYPLVIDPHLVYSTYLGGGNNDNGEGIAVDSSGNAYVIGSTSSTDFPTQNPIDEAMEGICCDAFVTKIRAAGSELIYSTYLGGEDHDSGFGIAVDNSGNAYVIGSTSSTDFPTQNPIQSYGGGLGAGLGDAFVAKINAAGSDLVYSTYLGGADTDYGEGIAIDNSGNTYVTGSTSSANFPTQHPMQASYGGGMDTGWGDAFVAKINAAGSDLVYSTYLGGSDDDIGEGIAVDSSGNAYVIGITSSTDFPTRNPIQASNAGGDLGSNGDAFVAKINAAGSDLVYSTYLGGEYRDYGFGIAIDDSCNAYVTGDTESAEFPTKNPIKTEFGGGVGDAFVTKINADGSAFVYSTYLGGADMEYGYGIAVDKNSNAYVTGGTYSYDWPTLDPTQVGEADAFIAKISASGSELEFLTRFYGNDLEEGRAIAVDSSSNAYITGVTWSDDFPTKNPIQASIVGDSDAFVAVLSSSDPVIGGRVWDDADYDGIQDPEEGGIGGVTANLCTADGTIVDTTKTGSDGRYSFISANVANNLRGKNGVAWPEFFVKFSQMLGKIFSPKDKGGDDTKDSDVDVVTGRTDVGSGSALDAGLKDASIANIKEFYITGGLSDYEAQGNCVFRRGDENPKFHINAVLPENCRIVVNIYKDGDLFASLLPTKDKDLYIADWDWISIDSDAGDFREVPNGIPVGKYVAKAEIISNSNGDDLVNPCEKEFYVIFNNKGIDECFTLDSDGYIYSGSENICRNGEIIKKDTINRGGEKTYKLNIFDAKIFITAINEIDGFKSQKEAADKLRAKISDTHELKWVKYPPQKYNTLDIIDTKEKPYSGQCFDYACLLTAYLRTVGIPARPITTTNFGDIELGGCYNFHCWTEAMVLEDNPSAPADKWYVLDSSNADCDPVTQNKCLLTDEPILPSEYWSLHLEEPSSIAYATTSSKKLNSCGKVIHDHKDIKYDHYEPLY